MPQCEEEAVENYLFLWQSGAKWLKIYHEYLKNGSAGEEDDAEAAATFQSFVKSLRQAANHCGEEMTFSYLYWNTYTEEDEERETALRDVLREIVENEQVKMVSITKRMTVLSRS